MSEHPVVIVGGGLAGLCCARRLAREGIETRLFEAQDRVGGRVRTNLHPGPDGEYRIDRGFQVYLDAYPESRSVLDYAGLRLEAFDPGAAVWSGKRFSHVFDPFRMPTKAAAGFVSPVASLKDILPLAGLHRRILHSSLDDLWAWPEQSTLDLLQETGLSSKAIDGFFRPFFGGVFFDRELATSARFFAFIYRMFAKGAATIPHNGIESIPAQIAHALPDGTVRKRSPVESVASDGVVLEGGERVAAKAVVVATDQPERWIDLPGRPLRWRSIVGLAFAAPASPLKHTVVALDGTGQGPVNHLAVVSDVQPSLAPAGRSLILATILGDRPESDADLEQQARTQLSGWFGAQGVAQWTLLRVDRISHALPDQSAGWLEQRRRPNRVEGVWIAGDHLDNASINGAMESGRRAAELLMAE